MIHTQLDDSYHRRSFSFSNWESASKGQSKFYYNYRSRQNQQRRDMPTFGQVPDRRSRQFYTRNLNQQYSYEYDSKSKKQFNSKPNYSLENWNKARNIAKRRQPDQYYGNLQNSGNMEIKKEIYNQNISNMGYLKSKPTRVQIQRATQQKLSNIDKINEKIKKILNTLNEEQKKICQHHIKVGNKKLGSHSFAQRIKTQGSDYSIQKNSNVEEKRNIYSKLTDIREKYYQHADNNLNNISNNSYHLERSRKLSQIDKFYGREYSKQFSRQQKRQYDRIKSNKLPSPFNILKDTYEFKQHQENIFQRNIYTKKQGMQYQNKQNKKYDIDSSALKFLKGTNAKSTDSLNLSMSICIKKQNQIPLQKKLKNQQIKVYNTNVVPVNQNLKDFKNDALNIKYNKNQQGNVKNDKKLYMYEQQPNEEENQKYQGERRKQSLNLNKRFKQNQSSIHTSNRAYGIDHDFTRNERTPIKSKNQKSLCRFQISQKSCKLSNGKDLDAEIQKIQKKIENCDNIKRQLNFQIDDTCRKSRMSLQKSLNKYKQLRSSASKQNYQIKRNDSVLFTQKAESKARNVSQFSTEKIIIAQRLGQNQLSQNRKQICQSNKQTNDVEVNLPKPFKMSQKKNSKKTVNNSAVKEIESTLISEERLQFNQQSLNLLVNKLCEQIQLDTEFRNSKKWFNRKPNFSKWNQLAKQLTYHKIGTNDKQNRQIFTMTQIQDNPFHTDRDQEVSYSKLIQNFLMSQKFWIENIQHKFSREEIYKNIMEIDIEKKGNITIEDMVRYINLQSDKYYRNRDLSLIYRRLSGTRGQVTVEYILAEFCYS